MSAIIADRTLSDLIDELETAASQVDELLQSDGALSDDLRGAIINALAALSAGANYLLRQRECNHRAERVRP
jgi:hypothetical protein